MIATTSCIVYQYIPGNAHKDIQWTIGNIQYDSFSLQIGKLYPFVAKGNIFLLNPLSSFRFILFIGPHLCCIIFSILQYVLLDHFPAAHSLIWSFAQFLFKNKVSITVFLVLVFPFPHFSSSWVYQLPLSHKLLWTLYSVFCTSSPRVFSSFSFLAQV